MPGEEEAAVPGFDAEADVDEAAEDRFAEADAEAEDRFAVAVEDFGAEADGATLPVTVLETDATDDVAEAPAEV